MVGTAVVITVKVLVALLVDPSVACSVSVTDCAPSERSLVGVKLNAPALSAVATPVTVVAPVIVIVMVEPALAVPLSVGRLVVTVAPEDGEESTRSEALSDAATVGVGESTLVTVGIGVFVGRRGRRSTRRAGFYSNRYRYRLG